jgi:predicted SnoaL-like aldol condensation-catalyzing enzyme
MIDVFNTGNLTEIAELVDVSYVDHQGVEGRGPDVFRRVVESSRRNGPPTVMVEDLISEGDRVIARLHWHWANPHPGVPQDRHTIDTVRFARGRAVEHWGSAVTS